MTNEKLKTAIANINAYLSESPADDDTVTLTVNVIRSVEEFMSEINSMNIEEALKNAEKCLEAFTSEDIIRQQQETINRKNTEINYLRKEYIPMLEKNLRETDKLGMEYMTESARLQTEIERLQKLLDDKCDRCIAKDKAEAVKEFAERLKEYVESYDVTTGYKIIIVNAVEEETIDNLVKETVGEG